MIKEIEAKNIHGPDHDELNKKQLKEQEEKLAKEAESEQKS
jgi:hypothetical protein